MSDTTPTLHMVCGKVAAGKSTLTAALGRAPGTVVISEDEWLKALYGAEMTSLADFLRCSARLRVAMGRHVVALLRAGVSVVLDFQANTLESRGWMREILAQTDAGHVLHVLDTPDEVCIARMHARNAAGGHPFEVTEAQFHRISKHVVLPTEDEGFEMVWHRA